MFVSRGDASGKLCQFCSGCGRDARAPRWCILIWDWLYERANYAEMGMRGSGAVEGRDDLLFNALDGFGIAERGEYDLLDTGVGELPD